jgi:hypothetical protein
MAMDDRWVQYSAQKAREGKCEIGMHLHAWNTPPEHHLEDKFGGAPYLTEYPAHIMEEKIAAMMTLLTERYETEIRSHRAGRWATSEIYFQLLAKHGIQVDCSVTPELDLSGIPGSTVSGANDYRRAEKGIHQIYPGILEVPMTTRRVRHAAEGTFRHRIGTLLKGDEMWLRPIRHSAEPMKQLTERIIREGRGEYLQFMVHSSELMPGGSIYFKSQEEVEQLYQVMTEYFDYLSQLGYSGAVLSDTLQW